MPTIKHRVFERLQDVFGRGGIWVDRVDRQPHSRRMKMMASFGVDHVFDVGAHRGGYACELRRHGYRNRITSFEPLPGPFQELSQRSEGDERWQIRNVALSESEGATTFHVAGNEVSSSLRTMADRHVRAAPASKTETVIEVCASTVDLEAESFGLPQMLKIDVQGAEAAVLDGAVETLARLRLIEAELSFVELYEGQLLVESMISRLRGNGFVPAGFLAGFTDPATGQGLQADAIFVREQ